MTFQVTLSKIDLENLIIEEIERQIGKKPEIASVEIMVKSQQNYKSEWEKADFKASYTASL